MKSELADYTDLRRIVDDLRVIADKLKKDGYINSFSNELKYKDFIKCIDRISYSTEIIENYYEEG